MCTAKLSALSWSSHRVGLGAEETNGLGIVHMDRLGRVVALLAPNGAGKSRLLRRVYQYIRSNRDQPANAFGIQPGDGEGVIHFEFPQTRASQFGNATEASLSELLPTLIN